MDEALNGFGLKVLETPVRTPMANAHCEWLIGTISPGVLGLSDPHE